MKYGYGDIVIETSLGDISDDSADAIVNAANRELWMGSGVAGAIKRRGGSQIEREAISKGPIEVGEAVVTCAGRLKARWVIHAAAMGPDFVTDEQKIRTATRNALKRAEELGARSVALPAIGTGAGGFPVDAAARAMIDEVLDHSSKTKARMTVRFVLFTDDARTFFERAIEAALKSIRELKSD